jgi:hypothetical protein
MFGTDDALMKFAITILTLSLFLAGCGTKPSDSTLQQRLVGTWTTELDNSRVIEVKQDGTYASRRIVNGTNATAEGTWQVRDGYVIGTVTKVSASWPDAESGTLSNRIYRLDNRTLIFAGRDGGKGLTLQRN